MTDPSRFVDDGPEVEVVSLPYSDEEEPTTAGAVPPLDTRDYVRDNDGQFADIPGVGNDAPKGGRVGGDAANARAAASPDKLKLGRNLPEGVSVKSSQRARGDEYSDLLIADVETPDGPQTRIGVVGEEDIRSWTAGFASPEVEKRRAELRRILGYDEPDDDEDEEELSEDEIEGAEFELENMGHGVDETFAPTAVFRPQDRARIAEALTGMLAASLANKKKQDADQKEYDAANGRQSALLEDHGDEEIEEDIAYWEKALPEAQSNLARVSGGMNPGPERDDQVFRWQTKVNDAEAELAELKEARFNDFPPEAKAEWDALESRKQQLASGDIDGLITSATVDGLDGSGIEFELWGKDWEGTDGSWSGMKTFVRPRNPEPGWKENQDFNGTHAAFTGEKDLKKLLKLFSDSITTAAVGAPNLFEHWVHGEGAAKIQWKVEGAFDRCVEQLDNYSDGGTEFDPEGLCARYYRAANGRWPGEKKGKDDTAMMEVLEDTGCVPCQLAPKPGEMWHAVAHIEGVSTGQRVWQPGSLSWREPPFAFHWEYSSSAHGGQPMTTHVGMVTRMARVGDEIHAWGNLDLANKDGAEVGRKLADGFIRGVSMGPGREKIVYDQVWPEGLTAAQMMTAEPEQWVFTDYMIGELTAVSVPAQAGAYVEPTDELLAALGKQRQIIPELTVAAGAPLLDIPHRPELNCCRNPLHPGPCKGWKSKRQTPSMVDDTPKPKTQRQRNVERQTPSLAPDPGSMGRNPSQADKDEAQRNIEGLMEKAKERSAKRRESRRGSVEKRTPKRMTPAQRMKTANDVFRASGEAGSSKGREEAVQERLAGMSKNEVGKVTDLLGLPKPRGWNAFSDQEAIDYLARYAGAFGLPFEPEDAPVMSPGRDPRAQQTALTVAAAAGSTWTVEVTDLPPADAFVKDFPPGTPPTITPDGRFYGYFAPGNTAHRGSWRQGVRKTAKQQGKTDYSRWLKEIPVAGGGTVLAGPITSNCMHAPTQGYGTLDRRHQFYEDVCSIVAKAAVGEDPDGARWFAGVLVPWITAQQIDQLLMCNLSLDTQPHAERAGWLDFVGVLAVPMGAWPMSTEGTGRIVTRVQEHDGLEVVTASSAPISFLAEPTIPDEVMWQLAGVDPATVMYDNQLVNAALKGAQL